MLNKHPLEGLVLQLVGVVAILRLSILITLPFHNLPNLPKPSLNCSPPPLPDFLRRLVVFKIAVLLEEASQTAGHVLLLSFEGVVLRGPLLPLEALPGHRKYWQVQLVHSVIQKFQGCKSCYQRFRTFKKHQEIERLRHM